MSFSVQSGWAARAYHGLTSCGDAAVVSFDEENYLFAVVDALGHGPDAAKSAARVTDVLRGNPGRSLREIFSAADAVLTGGLRGAVMSAVQVTPRGVLFAGVGNVDLLGPANVSRPACVAGILGRGVRTFREYPLNVSAGDRWVLVSDGIKARQVSKVLDALRKLAPEPAANQLIEQAGRPDDDATALVMDFEVRQ